MLNTINVAKQINNYGHAKITIDRKHMTNATNIQVMIVIFSVVHRRHLFLMACAGRLRAKIVS